MKKLFLILMTLFIFSCDNNDSNNVTSNKNQTTTVSVSLKNETARTISYEIINDSGDIYKSGTISQYESLPMKNFIKGDYIVRFQVYPYMTKFRNEFTINSDSKIKFVCIDGGHIQYSATLTF